tara:strand:- start:29 stop:313 length:285 start_codon:yes stop_codon:yes gene_type:complete
MKLNEEQLKNVQELQNEFSNSKLHLGDLVYKQSLLVKKIDQLKDQFTAMEAALIEEFGQDSVINLQTGEVKTKEEVEKEKEKTEVEKPNELKKA